MTTPLTGPVNTPPRNKAVPKSYAIFVGNNHIDVWQYRVSVSALQGEWHHVETLDQTENPRLDLEFAELQWPSDEGYWVYSKSYNCAFDCE